MSHMQRRPSVTALVMTYRAEASVSERLARIRPQVDRLIVVDNGSRDEVRAVLRDVVKAGGGEFVANERNRGTAAAINQAASIAVDGGADWLVTLDQDTNVPPTLVDDLLAAVASVRRPETIGIVGPTTTHQTDRRCKERRAVSRRLVITSGSMISLAAWQRAGPLREDWFIDMVEAEFALRVARHGLRVILACRAHIDHRIGEPTIHTLLGRRVSTTNHAAWRRYYLTRNRILVWREFWVDAPAWVAFDLFGHVRDTSYMVLFERDRRRKLRATLRGALDGLHGRTGMCVPPVKIGG